jgi:integrase/recombinase XerD
VAAHGAIRRSVHIPRLRLISSAGNDGNFNHPGGGDRALQAFETWMQGRALSAQTIKRRRTSLRGFTRHMAPAGLDAATTADVEEWLLTFSAARTRHAYRSDLSAFYKWAVRREVMPSNPVADTDSIRVPKGLPRPVPPDAIHDLIRYADNERLALAIALAAYAGLRISEIAALTSDDVSPHTVPPLLVVRHGKGGKDRTVPLHPLLVELLGRRRPNGAVVGWSTDRVGRNIANFMRASGYDCTAHQLRHTFGTELARISRGNIPMIGSLMGHSHASTTMGYVGWAGGEHANAIGKMYGSAS